MIKKLFISLLSIVLFTCGICTAKAQETQGYETFRLLIFGDSLSAGYRLEKDKGYIPQLQKALQEDGLDNVEVINASVSGDTTEDALRRIDKVLEQKPHAVVVQLGANDLLQKNDLNRTAINLNKIISTFLDKNIPVMLIGINIPIGIDINDRERMTKTYKDLAKMHNLIFYPHFLEGVLKETFGVYNFDYMQDDGAHPNEEGVQIMVKKTYPTIKKFLMRI